MVRWNLAQVIGLLLISVSAFPLSGKNCTEVLMRFSHFVEISNPNPTAIEKKETVEAQLEYLFGAMANSEYQGVPRGDKQVRILETELIDGQNSRIYYSYEGTALLQSGPRTHNTFPLPRVPTQEGVFDPAVDEKGFNHATDPHYQDFSDYWYFWNPTRPGSRLKEGVHYDLVTSDIQRLKRTEHSSPYYKQLVNSEGVIRVTAMFGMDDPAHSRNVNQGKDLGALGYRGFRKGLLEMGFEATELSTTEKEKIFGGHKFRGFTLERLTKDTPKGKIEILLFFGPSGISESSRAFHYVFKDSLERSSVVLYDGHSGLGAHLDIESIERAESFRIQRRPKDYQIFFLNSCSSYSYYNLSYHKLKDAENPTQYLDILTNGLETAFDETQKANLALIKAVNRWATTGKEQSYQSLAKIMDAANLFAVNGDSDNKKDN